MQADPLKDSLFSAENQIQSNMEINHPIHSDYYLKHFLFFRMLWSVFLVLNFSEHAIDLFDLGVSNSRELSI